MAGNKETVNISAKNYKIHSSVRGISTENEEPSLHATESLELITDGGNDEKSRKDKIGLFIVGISIIVAIFTFLIIILLRLEILGEKQVAKNDEIMNFIGGQIVKNDETTKFIGGQIVKNDETTKFIEEQRVKNEKTTGFIGGQIVKNKEIEESISDLLKCVENLENSLDPSSELFLVISKIKEFCKNARKGIGSNRRTIKSLNKKIGSLNKKIKNSNNQIRDLKDKIEKLERKMEKSGT